MILIMETKFRFSDTRFLYHFLNDEFARYPSAVTETHTPQAGVTYVSMIARNA